MSRLPTYSELPAEVLAFLTGGQSSVVATVDADGRPDTTLMSWLLARSAREIALCVDSRSRAFQNMVEQPFVSIEVLGNDMVYSVRGKARVEKPQLSAAPFPSALVVVEVEEVRDHSAPGTLFVGPSYSYAEDKQHRLDFERTIFEELRHG